MDSISDTEELLANIANDEEEETIPPSGQVKEDEEWLSFDIFDEMQQKSLQDLIQETSRLLNMQFDAASLLDVLKTSAVKKKFPHFIRIDLTGIRCSLDLEMRIRGDISRIIQDAKIQIANQLHDLLSETFASLTDEISDSKRDACDNLKKEPENIKKFRETITKQQQQLATKLKNKTKRPQPSAAEGSSNKRPKLSFTSSFSS